MNTYRKIYIFALLLAGALTSGPACGQEVSRTSADEILKRYLRSGQLATFKARSELEAALGVYREIGDVPGQAKSLILLGISDDAAGRHPQAMASYEEAQRALATIDDRLGMAI